MRCPRCGRVVGLEKGKIAPHGKVPVFSNSQPLARPKWVRKCEGSGTKPQKEHREYRQ